VVVVAPHADGFRFHQKTARLVDPLARLKYVAKHDDLVNLLATEVIQGAAQEFDGFVDVGEDAEFHGCV